VQHDNRSAAAEDAPVNCGTDRITGETREMWHHDPETGRLVPKLDADGRPVPRINPVTGAQEDPLGFLDDVAPSLAHLKDESYKSC
jgi:hypothetical protein